MYGFNWVSWQVMNFSLKVPRGWLKMLAVSEKVNSVSLGNDLMTDQFKLRINHISLWTEEILALSLITWDGNLECIFPNHFLTDFGTVIRSGNWQSLTPVYTDGPAAIGSWTPGHIHFPSRQIVVPFLVWLYTLNCDKWIGIWIKSLIHHRATEH